MLIEKYGILLRRLTLNDTELVRYWRNHPSIQQHMHYRTHITTDMQLKWFNSINNVANFFCIIEYEGEKLGLINAKDLDYVQKRGEAGIFLWNNDYKEQFISVKASLALCDFAYYILGMQQGFIKILSNNKEAISFNKQFGYTFYKQEAAYDWYVLSKETYERKSEKLKAVIQKMNQTPSIGTISLEQHDIGQAYTQLVIDSYTQSGAMNETQFRLVTVKSEK